MLRGDNDNGYALVPRRDHAGDQIRRPGTGIAKHRRHLAGRLVQPFRHVDGGSLVANRDESHFVLLQLGEQRIDLRTGESKHKPDTLADQTSDKKLSSSNFAHKILASGRLRRAPVIYFWPYAGTSRDAR